MKVLDMYSISLKRNQRIEVRDKNDNGFIDTQSVQAILLLAILEKLDEISEHLKGQS